MRHPLMTPLAVAALAGHAALALAGGQPVVPFDRLDWNRDGRLSSVEATADPLLISRWGETDDDENGLIDRVEFATFEEVRKQAEAFPPPPPEARPGS